MWIPFHDSQYDAVKKKSCQYSLILLWIMCLADKHCHIDIKDFYGLMYTVCWHRIIWVFKKWATAWQGCKNEQLVSIKLG